jgi:hypothetical protein
MAQDPDNWLRDREKVYNQCEQIKHPEVQGTHSVRDFLQAISTIVPEFATDWSNDIAK